MTLRPSFRSVTAAGLAILGLNVTLSTGFARPAVSPLLEQIGNGAPVENLAVTELAGVGPVLNLFVEGSASDAELEACGALIGTRLPNGLRTVKIPVARFAELAQARGLTRLTASYRCTPSNNSSVPTTGATPGFWTHSGAGVWAGNAGANVIVGMVDSGIDVTHEDFKKPDGTSRILSLWDQNGVASPPAGFAYGTEWTKAQIDGGSCTHVDVSGHGTHVLGSAAGDGSATGNGQPAYQFIGMAPAADLIVVATDFQTSSVADGVNYIFQKAQAAGKSAVVNLSLGTQFGAHDGTEAFDTAIDALTGAGRIVVAAAGNEGGAARHAEQLVPMGPAQTVTFNIPVYTANGGASNDYVLIDAYYPAGTNMSVSLTSPGPSAVTVGPVVLGATGSNAGSLAGNIFLENGATPSPSGDRNVFIQIYDSNVARPPRAGTWTITLTPVSTNPGTEFDAWLAGYQLGTVVAPVFTSDVEEAELVASPGSAAQAITAGAYITKGSWPSIDGNSYSYSGLTTVGALAGYSCPGPLRNGALKPDIAGPGSAIVSSRSAAAGYTNPVINPDGRHVTETGTSMAAPHVAGACALLLAQTPTLTPAQIKLRLAADARVDAFTGAVPNGLWGAGKLRILNPDLTPPTVTLTAPNGAESWTVGDPHDLTWTATDNLGVVAVDLSYSIDNGGAWIAIASGEANDGTYSWMVPNTPTTQALVRVQARDAAGNSTPDQSNATFTIGAASAVGGLPAVLTRPLVLQNRPNPFNPVTRIGFGLPRAGHARITVFSAAGRRIRSLVDGEFAVGYHEVAWDGTADDGSAAPSGVYFYRFEAETVVETRRLVISK